MKLLTLLKGYPVCTWMIRIPIWMLEHVITVAELWVSMHGCRPTIATFTSWCLDQQGLHMKVKLPRLRHFQTLIVLFTSHDMDFLFIQPPASANILILVLHSLLPEKAAHFFTTDLVCRMLLGCTEMHLKDCPGCRWQLSHGVVPAWGLPHGAAQGGNEKPQFCILQVEFLAGPLLDKDLSSKHCGRP